MNSLRHQQGTPPSSTPATSAIPNARLRFDKKPITPAETSTTPLNFEVLLGISKNRISALQEEKWLETIQCMTENPELSEANLRNMLQSHRVSMEELERQIRGYLDEARGVISLYLTQRYPENPDIQAKKDFLPEVKTITDVSTALYTLFATTNELRLNRNMAPEKKKHAHRIIFEAKQLLGLMLHIRNIEKTCDIMNREVDSYYFEQTLLRENLKMIDPDTEPERVEIRFVVNPDEKEAMVFLPENPRYDTLLPGQFEARPVYRTMLTGRTSMTDMTRKSVQVYFLPGNGEKGKVRQNSIMNFKNKRAIALKQIRNALDPAANERMRKEVLDGLRMTAMTETNEEKETVIAMIDTELASTIHAKKWDRDAKKYSSDEYISTQRTLSLANEEEKGRRFYMEIRIGKLSELLLVESHRHAVGQRAFKQNFMKMMDSALRPEKIYDKAE